MFCKVDSEDRVTTVPRVLHRSRKARSGLAALVAVAALGLATCGASDPPVDSDPGDAPTTTRASQTTDTPTPSEPTQPDSACDGLRVVDEAPVVSDPPLAEISGAVASSRTPGAFWVHEDSSNPTVLVELTEGGRQISRWDVPGVDMVDWEDIAALVDDDGTRHLFVGDIGDNLARRDHTRVLRLPEPGADQEPGPTPAPAILELRSPLGPADAEALLADPASGDLVVVTKSVRGLAEVLVAPGGAWADDGARLDLVHAGTLALGPIEAVLAGDVSPDGTLIGLRTPTRVLLWERHPGDDLATTLLGGSWCRAASRFDIFGEAFAFTDDGYVLLGEGSPTDVVVVR